MLSSKYQPIKGAIERGKVTPNLLEIIALCVIAASIWLPRRISLNRVVTPDEIHWFNRSARFNLALKQNMYSKTYQKEHPGVILMWIGSAAYDNVFQKYRANNPEFSDRLTIKYYINGISKQNPLEILVESRKILALVHTAILLLAYWFTRRIIGVGPAVIGFALIAFDPFHLALTRIMHLDGLLANFYLLSLVAYISFTQERKPFDLIISGITAGLAWLTKSPGLILIPTLGIVTLLQMLQKTRQENQLSWTRIIWQEVWPFVLWGLLGVFVFIAAWPAMWVAPFEALSKVLGIAQTYASFGHHTGIFFNGQIIEGGEFGLRYFYFYPFTFLWRTTPLGMIGLFAFILGLIKWIKLLADPKIRWFSTILLIAIFIYIFVMTLGQKRFDRYILPVYAFLDILAGLGWYALILWLNGKLSLRVRTIVLPLTLGFVIILQAGSSLRIFPNMLAYYNPLMGGSRKAPEVMQIGWGEGLDQAALYLNQKTNAENLVVSSWYGLGPFSFFFNGDVFDIPNGIITDDNWQAINSSDYIVSYVHQWQRNLPEDLLSELATKKPEHTIWINGIEYVKIYQQKQVLYTQFESPVK